jgi:hypothetical protein
MFLQVRKYHTKNATSIALGCVVGEMMVYCQLIERNKWYQTSSYSGKSSHNHHRLIFLRFRERAKHITQQNTSTTPTTRTTTNIQ